jgi:hypothetical protein
MKISTNDKNSIGKLIDAFVGTNDNIILFDVNHRIYTLSVESSQTSQLTPTVVGDTLTLTASPTNSLTDSQTSVNTLTSSATLTKTQSSTDILTNTPTKTPAQPLTKHHKTIVGACSMATAVVAGGSPHALRSFQIISSAFCENDNGDDEMDPEGNFIEQLAEQLGMGTGNESGDVLLGELIILGGVFLVFSVIIRLILVIVTRNASFPNIEIKIILTVYAVLLESILKAYFDTERTVKSIVLTSITTLVMSVLILSIVIIFCLNKNTMRYDEYLSAGNFDCLRRLGVIQGYWNRCSIINLYGDLAPGNSLFWIMDIITNVSVSVLLSLDDIMSCKIKWICISTVILMNLIITLARSPYNVRGDIILNTFWLGGQLVASIAITLTHILDGKEVILSNITFYSIIVSQAMWLLVKLLMSVNTTRFLHCVCSSKDDPEALYHNMNGVNVQQKLIDPSMYMKFTGEVERKEIDPRTYMYV